MTEQRLTVPAPGGRELEVMVAGRPGGRPLVFHNGTPGGLVAYGREEGAYISAQSKPPEQRSGPELPRDIHNLVAAHHASRERVRRLVAERG